MRGEAVRVRPPLMSTPKDIKQSEATKPKKHNSTIVVRELSACVSENERMERMEMVVITTSKMSTPKYTGLGGVVRLMCLWAIAEHR
jgi:hypothetical protein